MSINTLEYAAVFMQELDNQMVECATSGWMEDNAGQAQYHGGAEVKIPKMELSGLGNYDRDKGFASGSVTVNYETKKMTQDRGRTFQVDAMDVDETNFAAVAGNVMGEFQRSKVIPEIDAYRYSTIAALAETKQKTKKYIPAKETIWETLLGDLTEVRDKVGDGVEIVITMSAKVAGMLDIAKGSNYAIGSGEFTQGSATMKVREIDGCPVIRVPSARFQTKYEFYDGVSSSKEAGGFVAAADAKDMNWIIAVRQAPIAVSKTDVTRIFDPMTNQNANAWKIDYRKYHDLWITDHGMEGILVSVQEKAGTDSGQEEEGMS